MKMLNAINHDVKNFDQQVNELVESTAVTANKTLFEHLFEQETKTVNKGDLIIDSKSPTMIYVVTGALREGNIVVANKSQREYLNPNGVVPTGTAKSQFTRKIVSELERKFPNRGIYLYDKSVSDQNPIVATESIINPQLMRKKATENNPVENDEVSPKDTISGVALDLYFKTIKQNKQENTSTGSEVKNDPNPWETFVKTKFPTLGDKDPGNVSEQGDE